MTGEASGRYKKPKAIKISEHVNTWLFQLDIQSETSVSVITDRTEADLSSGNCSLPFPPLSVLVPLPPLSIRYARTLSTPMHFGDYIYLGCSTRI